MCSRRGDRKIALCFRENPFGKKWVFQNQYNPLRSILLNQVFNSGFSEGRSGVPIRSQHALDDSSTDESHYNLGFNQEDNNHDDTMIERRRVVKISEDYHIFHDILYYIYTDIITFYEDDATPTGQLFETPQGYASKVEKLFAAADFYLLNGLRQKAIAFLRRTCSLKNIAFRVFGHTAVLYPEIDEIYSSYFKANLKDVMKHRSYQFFFDLVEGSSDSDWKASVNSKFRKLVQEEVADTNVRVKRRKSAWWKCIL